MAEVNKLLEQIKKQTFRAKHEAEEITKSVVNKTNSMVTHAKLSYSINEIQDKIQELLIDLGEIIYEEYCRNDDIEGEIGTKCEQIRMLYKDIDNLKDKIATAKSCIRCCSCGEYNNLKNTYCSACGEKLIKNND